MLTMWKKTDPRLDINKRADIVILRPGCNGMMAGTAHVDTKSGWNIFTSFDDYRLIAADAEWDQDWQWTFAP